MGFTIAEAPIQAGDNKAYVKMTAAELTKQVWSGQAFFAKVSATEGKYLTSSATYRGAFSTQEVDLCVEKVQSTQSDDFVEWIPNNNKAFLHWYKGEGMDEMEFQEADKNVRDL